MRSSAGSPRAFELDPDDAGSGAAPRPRYSWSTAGPRVGVIGSVTRPFCGACDRVRLTADGQIRNCLFATEESDLRAAMRSAPMTTSWPRAGWPRCAVKKAGHGIDDPCFLQPSRPMSAIGG